MPKPAGPSWWEVVVSRSPRQAPTGSVLAQLSVFLRRLSGVAGAGLVGWLVDVGLLWVGHEVVGLPAAFAAAIGFLAGGLANFLLNRIVFAEGQARMYRQAWRYAALFGLNLLVVTLSVPLVAAAVAAFASGVPAPLVAAKVVVTGLLLPLNAWVYGAWVFEVDSRCAASVMQ
jgi:putative flippase GtrA